MIEQKYILDANVFITSKNSYYDPQFHPGFWKFLDLGIHNGTFILHRRVYEELKKGRDELSQRVALWEPKVKNPSPAEMEKFREVCTYTVSQPQWIKKVDAFLDGADPWLVAHACISSSTIVTLEKTDIEANCKSPKLPAVARKFGCKSIGLYSLIRECKPIFELKADPFL